MNIIYRIYEVNNWYFDNKVLITQDVCNTESLDDFKKMMRCMYGEDLKFRLSKNSKNGDIICTIISTNCYNPEKYLGMEEHKCTQCSKVFKITPNLRNEHQLSSSQVYNLKKLNPNYVEENNPSNKLFCSLNCLKTWYENEEKNILALNEKLDYLPIEWQSRNDWSTKGYIYKIRKKSSGEFYIGQSNALPVFRWSQHLKTNRFPLENITDYCFEVLEVVEDLKQLNKRESYWINKTYNMNPSKCLNKIIPSTCMKEKIDLED